MNSPIIGVSSWALHRELGSPPFYGAAQGGPISANGNARLSLLEMPAELAKRGIGMMEICHFHLPSCDAGYLRELRESIEKSGVQLHALLIDDGDLTNPETCHRDLEWITDWLPVAAQLGAKKARVIAGKSAGPGAVSTSATMLRLLSRFAQAQGVRINTENWFPLLNTPAAVLQLLTETEGRADLNLDFGNWSGAAKYDDLAAIAPYATSCHAKADFAEDGALVADDYARCLNLPYPPEFRGPFTLVAGGSGESDWQGIEATRDFILQHFAATA